MAAVLMIMSGVLTQQSAMQGVDINTIGLLTGMMIIVGITRESGVFQYLAIRSAKLVKGDPWGILVMLVFVTAVLSAILDNVTTVLLIAPVTLLITDTLKLSAYPYLFAEIFAANIGGTATLIGDPPNIMIGSATGLGYNDFLFNLAPIASTGLLEMLAQQVLALTDGDKTVTAISILFVSAVASAIVDNIPFVATMIPLIKNMAASFGGAQELIPIWWSLALGSCLGGNGSLVGAS
ncbi:PREDICTED: uncharacterized transporter MT2759-like, partial [Priapulus caudatus]|uniref:Uncharacterized transporter MT2759-like n=1 Tax=Priapulus caudatus TaxID=37621 RepID=A0ABM1F644_PRICU